MDHVDYQKKLKEWYEHYEARYKKAVSLHIDEGSRHYQAFREIECRYVALYLVMELMQNLPAGRVCVARYTPPSK